MPQGTLLAFFSNLIIPQFQISASGKLFAFAQTRSVHRWKCSSAFKRKIINQWYIKEFAKYF
jgi:hypothetical protein